MRMHRVRKNISGTAQRPRLSVFRSLNSIYAQIIDDKTGKTLVAASDLKIKKGAKSERAAEVGKKIAVDAKKAKVTKVVFDRGGFKYFGRIKTLADAARKNGLEF
jgi:large subunit ribosomal protein L18